MLPWEIPSLVGALWTCNTPLWMASAWGTHRFVVSCLGAARWAACKCCLRCLPPTSIHTVTEALNRSSALLLAWQALLQLVPAHVRWAPQPSTPLLYCPSLHLARCRLPACPDGDQQHHAFTCFLQVCFDQEHVISFDPAYSPTNTTSEPLPQLNLTEVPYSHAGAFLGQAPFSHAGVHACVGIRSGLKGLAE